jgi:hypothetical protein
MSYVVEVLGHSVRCETPAAVYALLSSNGQAEHAGEAKVKRKYTRRKTTAKGKRRRLGGIQASWDNAKRLGKQLGRTDYAVLRSEIASGKHNKEGGA